MLKPIRPFSPWTWAFHLGLPLFGLLLFLTLMQFRSCFGLSHPQEDPKAGDPVHQGK